jgi:hypothetical protein
MEDDFNFGRKARLVTDNRGDPLFRRSAASCRKRRQISVHREWNEHTEWWVGHVFADRQVHRIGVFTSPERAFAATIAYYYEIVAKLEREDRLAEEEAVAAATAAANTHRAFGRAEPGDIDSATGPSLTDRTPAESRAARTGAASGALHSTTNRT